MKKLLLSIGFILAINIYSYCMNQKNNEQKSDPAFDKHIVSINQTLQQAGLLPDLCKIIGQYDGWRLYHTFDRTNDDHTNAVYALEYIQDYKYLASGWRDEIIKLWDLDKDSKTYKSCIATFDRTKGGHTNYVYALTYIPDYKYLASGSYDNTIKLWDLDKDSKTYKSCIATFDRSNGGHNDFVIALIYIPDYKYLASGGADRTIKLWDLDKDSKTYQTCIAIFDKRNGGHTHFVFAMTYIKDIKCLTSSSGDGTIKLWDMNKDSKTYQTCIATFDKRNGGHTDIVSTLIYIKDIKYLASGYRDGIIKLWDLDKYSKTYQTCIATFDKTNGGHTYFVFAMTYIKDIKCLTSSSRDATIKLWDLDKDSKTYQTCIATFDERNGGHTSGVYALAYIPDYKYLASCSDDVTIKLWINMKDFLGNFPKTENNEFVGPALWQLD